MFHRPHGPHARRFAQAPDDADPVSLKTIPWRRLLGYLKPYRGRMALALLALLVSSSFGLLFPMVIVRLLDAAARGQGLAALNGSALVLLGIFAVQAAASFTQASLLAMVGEHIVCDLRTTLYRHLHNLSLDFHGNRRVGEIVSRLSSDVTQMRTVLTSNLTSLLSQTVSLVGALTIVLSINLRLTLLIFALVPPIILLVALFGRRIQKISTAVQDRLAAATTVAEEALQGIRIVKSFGREGYETERYGSAIHSTLSASIRMALLHSGFASVMTFLGFGTIAAILWAGGREVVAGRMSLGMINGFLMYGVMITGALGGLAGLYAQFRAALGGVQRVFEILDAHPTVRDAQGAVELPAAEGAIRFDDVTFAYEPGVPVIRGISLDIEPGEILALVGPSGAGKSTLFNLIPRFYDPAGGSVRIDGRDLRSVTQQSLREQMAIVPQETMLFGGSIRENILYGRLDATEDEMVEAARAANAHDFILELPQGYETVVGERGTKLSGGQRQRIAIARALLKDPRILLLDEATSSLDNDSEGLVQQALNRLMRDRTTVIIAHRLSTIKVAHRIAVLDAGHIVEVGTHADLMALDGLYARLYALQFAGAEAVTQS